MREQATGRREEKEVGKKEKRRGTICVLSVLSEVTFVSQMKTEE